MSVGESVGKTALEIPATAPSIHFFICSVIPLSFSIFFPLISFKTFVGFACNLYLNI
jgi:hypothetical protein